MTTPRTEQERLFRFINNAPVDKIKEALGESPRPKESPPVAASTTAPKFDPAAFAAQVQESSEPVARKSSRDKYANNPYVAHLDKSRKSGKPMQLSVPGHSVKELSAYLRDAAEKGGHGLRLAVPADHPTDAKPVTVRFQAVEKRKVGPRKPGSKAECPVCHAEVSVTGEGTLRKHGPRDNRCAGSGRAVSAE